MFLFIKVILLCLVTSVCFDSCVIQFGMSYLLDNQDNFSILFCVYQRTADICPMLIWYSGGEHLWECGDYGMVWHGICSTEKLLLHD